MCSHAHLQNEKKIKTEWKWKIVPIVVVEIVMMTTGNNKNIGT